jgi:hypothetical protein
LGSAHSTARPARPSGLAPLGVSAHDRRNRGGGIPFDAGGLLAKSGRPTAVGRRGSGLGVTLVDGDPDLGRRVVGDSPWRARGGDGTRAEGCAGEGVRSVVVGSVGEVREHLRARAMLLAGSTGPEEHQRRQSTGRRPRQRRRQPTRCYNGTCEGGAQWPALGAWSGGGP